MKYIFIAVLLIVTQSLCSGQPVLKSDYAIRKGVNNAITAYINTQFSFGYGPTCPIVVFWKSEIFHDTLFLKAIYDITGAWPQAGCESSDSLNFNQTSTGVHYINISTNAVSYLSNPTRIDTVWNIYDSTFVFNPLNVQFPSLATKGLIRVWPNPCKDYLLVDMPLNEQSLIIKIYNSLGQLILVRTDDNTKQNPIDIRNLTNGMYYISAYSSLHIYRGGFEKRNE